MNSEMVEHDRTSTIAALAGEIVAAHEAACLAARAGLDHARRAGELLMQAKAEVQHGEWLGWLALHCPAISERTAQVYMRIAREWPELEAKAQRVADLPVRHAIALLAERSDSSEGEKSVDDHIARLIAEANDQTVEAEYRRMRAELRVFERALAGPLTIEELAAMVERIDDIERQMQAMRFTTMRNLGTILNWLDEHQGPGKTRATLQLE
jgi:hypothetical protein